MFTSLKKSHSISEMGTIEKTENTDNIKTVIVNKGPLIGKRHIISLFMFFLVTVAYSMRINLSVGIVAMTNNSSSPNPDIPVYNWTNKSFILSTFFMGYVWLQIVAGELTKRYGSKWFLAGSMIVNSVACISIPFMADKFSYYGVIVCRITQGLFQGFFYPSIQNILAKWAPVDERSTLANITYTGSGCGAAFAMLVTGLISGTWAGWPAAFYFFGSLGFLWTILWVIVGSSSPAEDRSITLDERRYIEASLDSDKKQMHVKTPWKAIFTSLPVWAIIVASYGQIWGYSILLTEIPNYLNKVCNEDISENSLLSAAPYLAGIIFGLIFGPLADWLIDKKILSTIATRKLMQTLGSLIPALALIILGFIPKDNIGTIETLLVVGVGINAAVLSGVQVNHIDLSPRFSGVLMGIANGSSNIFAIISPNLVQAIVTDEKNPNQWRIIFLIAAAAYLSTNVFYLIYARADRQWWDNDDEEEKNKV